MARIIDVHQLIQKLIPVLGKRVRDMSELEQCRLSVQTDIGRVGLDVSRDGVEICRPEDGIEVVLPQAVLAQVILGYRGADEVAARDGVRIPKSVLPLLSKLFPRGCPYMWNADRF